MIKGEIYSGWVSEKFVLDQPCKTSKTSVTSRIDAPQPQPQEKITIPNAELRVQAPETFTPETFTRTNDDGIEFVIKIVDGQETVIKHIVRENLGGRIVLSAVFWAIIEEGSTSEVEIRGPCISACTWVAVFIPKNRLCFDANGYLAFHTAYTLNKDGSKSPELKTTRETVNSYPKDIRAWINAKGGYKKMSIDGFWNSARARAVDDGLSEVWR